MDKLKKRMIEALSKTLGRVTHACEIVDIARSTNYSWLKDDPDYAQAVKDVDEQAMHFVESKLMQLIDGADKEVLTEHGIQTIKDTPSTTAAIFYLKTKAKHRGYVERQEITGADGGAVQIIADNV